MKNLNYISQSRESIEHNKFFLINKSDKDVEEEFRKNNQEAEKYNSVKNEYYDNFESKNKSKKKGKQRSSRSSSRNKSNYLRNQSLDWGGELQSQHKSISLLTGSSLKNIRVQSLQKKTLDKTSKRNLLNQELLSTYMSTNNQSSDSTQKQLPNLFEKKISLISDKTIDNSSLTNSKFLQLFDPENLIFEIFFRYSHEVNKILFWLNTVRQIFNYLFKNKMCKSLVVFGVLILQKAKARTKFLYKGLVRRENKYQMIRFKEFLESKKYEEILVKLKVLNNQCGAMEKQLKQSSRLSFFVKKYQLDRVMRGEIGDKEYQKVMTSQLQGLLMEKFFKPKKTKSSSITYQLWFAILKNYNDDIIFITYLTLTYQLFIW